MEDFEKAREERQYRLRPNCLPRLEVVFEGYREASSSDTYKLTICSPLHTFFPQWFAYYASKDDTGAEKVLEHNPAFWQSPSLWWSYCLQERCDGNICRAILLYLQAMIWKLKLLVKLTCGKSNLVADRSKIAL